LIAITNANNDNIASDLAVIQHEKKSTHRHSTKGSHKNDKNSSRRYSPKLMNMELNEMFQNNNRKSSVGEGASSPKVESADIKIDDI
jgi:hypothetical protein